MRADQSEETGYLVHPASRFCGHLGENITSLAEVKLKRKCLRGFQDSPPGDLDTVLQLKWLKMAHKHLSTAGIIVLKTKTLSCLNRMNVSVLVKG